MSNELDSLRTEIQNLKDEIKTLKESLSSKPKSPQNVHLVKLIDVKTRLNSSQKSRAEIKAFENEFPICSNYFIENTIKGSEIARTIIERQKTNHQSTTRIGDHIKIDNINYSDKIGLSEKQLKLLNTF